jgi:hypothetical protein
MTKTNTPQVKIVNVETGEEIVRDANSQELEQMELDAANAATAQAKVKAKEASRQAILDRLGLTADEAAILLG